MICFWVSVFLSIHLIEFFVLGRLKSSHDAGSLPFVMNLVGDVRSSRVDVNVLVVWAQMRDITSPTVLIKPINASILLDIDFHL